MRMLKKGIELVVSNIMGTEATSNCREATEGIPIYETMNKLWQKHALKWELT